MAWPAVMIFQKIVLKYGHFQPSLDLFSFSTKAALVLRLILSDPFPKCSDSNSWLPMTTTHPYGATNVLPNDGSTMEKNPSEFKM